MVTISPEEKELLSNARRFPSRLCLNGNPGPASYDCRSSAEVQSPSFSKKGTTGFVPSKPLRASRNPHRGVPGPNTYNLQRSLTGRRDFNAGVSRVFRLPVAVPPGIPKRGTPAPNQYDVGDHWWALGGVLWPSVNVFSFQIRRGSKTTFSWAGGTSAFLSKTGRGSFCLNKNVPSPCNVPRSLHDVDHSKAVLFHLMLIYSFRKGHYDVNNSSIQRGSRAVLSPFKSNTQRIPPPVDHHVPGPGAYSPHQAPPAVKRTLLPRGHYLAISAPPLIVPKAPPLPGPGQYDIGTPRGPPKHPMPTAAFASRTERIPQKPPADRRPGPGFYDPHVSPKRSFFYNDSRVWIPV
ncbi:LOW QUALITY PROTEIN: O(6)-methylguanine-induced apoptosis 2 [Antennarius striatus]|uniref:LOW QUALITY PROTEIN: O(6)-methylguanine-induced apoptosis 2 n=1 Tax=Antennarius striatus TaxID=241820 RepID=UPI0035AD8A2B